MLSCNRANALSVIGFIVVLMNWIRWRNTMSQISHSQFKLSGLKANYIDNI